MLQTLLADPRLPEVVDDIVIEYGNALYQDLIDRFVRGDAPVNDADLRLVWRNNPESPANTCDPSVVEQFYRRVRAVNWPLPPERCIRLLVGDPPIDWSTITTAQQVEAFVAERDTFGRRRCSLRSTCHQRLRLLTPWLAACRLEPS